MLYMIVEAAIELLLQRPATRQRRAEWLHRVCARVLRRLGLRVRVEGAPPPSGAVILNHQSYLDIFVMAGLARCVFVAKMEMRSWPVIGWMTTMAGTVYVDRGRGGSAAATTADMREAAAAGLPFVFFPEGTTTNGVEMLPFRSGLLSEARKAGLPVTAGYLQYSLPAVTCASLEDDVAYWGERSLPWHIVRFLTLTGVQATVRFAPEPIQFRAENRKLAAIEARAAVLALAPQETAVPPQAAAVSA